MLKNTGFCAVRSKAIFKGKKIIYGVKKARRTKTMKHENNNPLAKAVKSALDATLRMSANSTSCCVVHQPKAPKKLDAFRKIK